jgi:SAM-dependent methyltransferase
MASRRIVRLAITGVGLALAALAFYFLVQHVRRAPPAPAAPNGFNPAEFVKGRPQLDAPYIATDMQVVDAMLALARVRPGEYVIDLGSGDGRILIAAARSSGARGLGVDIDPARIRESNDNARAAGVTGQVDFRQQDLFATPLAEADVLTLYLLPEINLRLRPRILAEMRPGTRVLSHDFDMGDWRWDQRQRVDNATIYLWTVPARAAGNWTLTLQGRPYPLVLEQHYQQLLGTVGTARVEQGRLNGADIRFIANVGGARRTFEGRVDGNTIVPTARDADWVAQRAPEPPHA